VALSPAMGHRVAAYLEGYSLTQLRDFPPGRKKPLTVDMQFTSMRPLPVCGVAKKAALPEKLSAWQG